MAPPLLRIALALTGLIGISFAVLLPAGAQYLAPEQRLIGQATKGKPKAGGLGKLLEKYIAPVKPFLDNPRGKHWLGQARLYNARNGVTAKETPRYLLSAFPLAGEGR